MIYEEKGSDLQVPYNYSLKVANMRQTNNRYTVNAVGTEGQIYLTNCKDKHELKQWLAKHEHHIIKEELQIIDKKRLQLFKMFSFKK